MSKQKTLAIRPLDGFSNVSDAEVLARGTSVVTNMTGNANYANPPVDLAALKAGIDKFSALMAEALDGSKKVVAEKNRQRKEVIRMLRLLGRYVEVTCKDDMAIFKSSGFEPASTAKAPAPPLSEKIRKVAHGPNSGQIVVWIKTVPKATSYELRYGVPGPAGSTPGTWITQLVTTVKTPVTLSGLTPGTTYVFQARALTKAGYTDYSDSIAFMST
jgi:hypothetical protein